MTDRSRLRDQLTRWLSDGFTSVNETPLDDYGREVVRDVLALLSESPEPAETGRGTCATCGLPFSPAHDHFTHPLLGCTLLPSVPEREEP